MTNTDPRITPALPWLADHVDGASGPLKHELITGGRSNLTFRVGAHSGASWILRRQPIGPMQARAHDLGREFRILTALSGHTSLPVPTPLALCEDESVLGVTFYVMADVPGVVLRDAADTTRLGEPARWAAARNTVHTLATLHATDLGQAGLSDLGPNSGYVERQLRRWQAQVEQTGDAEMSDLLREQQLQLLDAMPLDGRTTLVHGDYRFDNVVLDPDTGSVRAVLDWEIATLGDPLADLGSFLAAWDDPREERFAFGYPGPTAAPGFPSWLEAAQWYAESLSIELAALDFYLAFGYWKLGCVLHCVAHRYRHGGGGGAGSEDLPDDMAGHVRWLNQRCAEHLSRHRVAAW